ncbi:MAG: phosphosulfolactate synthase [Thermobacillus sp. ZCTH02-B1]|uniref:phosphosulfolactate synthase n=1 Tax=Thermobacillus sp. ZCTH02-B1 TaxID=1858795 RepID=UPI000B5684B9|nr:phosphosulfolactate synthase [Thermobacillus sp. ZCTH02-B1]OUM96879.1 MAG: phosphosulfolactate synthase [Thermobacillus sp. ZCTH02-B1]
MRQTLHGAWIPELRDPSGGRADARHPAGGAASAAASSARTGGKTMVIDRGLGWHAWCDLIDSAGAYVDVIKLGFGTSVLYPDELLLRKIGYARRHGITVMPGGTLLETAVRQGAEAAFFDAVCGLGFDGVEVSEGTIELGRRRRTELIREGRARGLKVFAEYGKKAEGSAIDPEALRATAEADWEAGAELVTIETRESGTVGLFGGDGRPDRALFERIIRLIPRADRLMWEAPRKEQQVFLIRELGPNVHLGNIAPGDVLALEAMRRALRNDTFMLQREPEFCDYAI